MCLNQVGKLIQQSASLGGAHRGPRFGFQGPAGGFNGQVYVGLVTLGNLTDGIAGGGVDCFKRLARYAVDPLPADQHLLVRHLRWCDGFGSRHAFILVE